MARLLPQLIKAIGYNEEHDIRRPRNAQWDLCFADLADTYKQEDSFSCALYCLKTVERLISKIPEPKGLETPMELNAYRFRIAQTIYTFSTDEEAIQVPIPMTEI